MSSPFPICHQREGGPRQRSDPGALPIASGPDPRADPHLARFSFVANQHSDFDCWMGLIGEASGQRSMATWIGANSA